MEYPFETLFDRVLVRPQASKKEKEILRDDGTTTIIEIPDQYREQSKWGEILAMGSFFVVSGLRFDPKDFLNIGDIILFSEYNAEKQFINEEELLLIRILDIRGRKRGYLRSE